jgi:hypothetical protein
VYPLAQRSASSATRDKLYCWGLAAVPTKAEIIEVSRFCGPLFLIRLGVSYYWSSCAYAAAAAGTVSLASHQVLIGMFWLFTMVRIRYATPNTFEKWPR